MGYYSETQIYFPKTIFCFLVLLSTYPTQEVIAHVSYDESKYRIKFNKALVTKEQRALCRIAYGCLPIMKLGSSYYVAFQDGVFKVYFTKTRFLFEAEKSILKVFTLSLVSLDWTKEKNHLLESIFGMWVRKKDIDHRIQKIKNILNFYQCSTNDYVESLLQCEKLTTELSMVTLVSDEKNTFAPLLHASTISAIDHSVNCVNQQTRTLVDKTTRSSVLIRNHLNLVVYNLKEDLHSTMHSMAKLIVQGQ